MYFFNKNKNNKFEQELSRYLKNQYLVKINIETLELDTLYTTIFLITTWSNSCVSYLINIKSLLTFNK